MDRYKVLGQLANPTGAVSTVLYTVLVPASVSVGGIEVAPKATSIHVQSLVTGLMVCENAGGAAAGVTTFDMKLITAAGPSTTYVVRTRVIGTVADPSGVTAAYPNVPLVCENFFQLGMTLSPGDALWVEATSDTVHYTLFGIEVTSGRGPDV